MRSVWKAATGLKQISQTGWRCRVVNHGTIANLPQDRVVEATGYVDILVNAMLLRIHQSGHLAEMNAENFELIREGITLHQKLAKALSGGVPFWPLGLAGFESNLLCLGMDCGEERFLAVWCLDHEESRLVFQDDAALWHAELLYPSSLERKWKWSAKGLEVAMRPGTASIFGLRRA